MARLTEECLKARFPFSRQLRFSQWSLLAPPPGVSLGLHVVWLPKAIFCWVHYCVLWRLHLTLHWPAHLNNVTSRYYFKYPNLTKYLRWSTSYFKTQNTKETLSPALAAKQQVKFNPYSGRPSKAHRGPCYMDHWWTLAKSPLSFWLVFRRKHGRHVPFVNNPFS